MNSRARVEVHVFAPKGESSMRLPLKTYIEKATDNVKACLAGQASVESVREALLGPNADVGRDIATHFNSNCTFTSFMGSVTLASYVSLSKHWDLLDVIIKLGLRGDLLSCHIQQVPKDDAESAASITRIVAALRAAGLPASRIDEDLTTPPQLLLAAASANMPLSLRAILCEISVDAGAHALLQLLQLCRQSRGAVPACVPVLLEAIPPALRVSAFATPPAAERVTAWTSETMRYVPRSTEEPVACQRSAHDHAARAAASVLSGLPLTHCACKCASPALMHLIYEQFATAPYRPSPSTPADGAVTASASAANGWRSHTGIGGVGVVDTVRDSNRTDITDAPTAESTPIDVVNSDGLAAPTPEESAAIRAAVRARALTPYENLHALHWLFCDIPAPADDVDACVALFLTQFVTASETADAIALPGDCDCPSVVSFAASRSRSASLGPLLREWVCARAPRDAPSALTAARAAVRDAEWWCKTARTAHLSHVWSADQAAPAARAPHSILLSFEGTAATTALNRALSAENGTTAAAMLLATVQAVLQPANGTVCRETQILVHKFVQLYLRVPGPCRTPPLLLAARNDPALVHNVLALYDHAATDQGAGAAAAALNGLNIFHALAENPGAAAAASIREVAALLPAEKVVELLAADTSSWREMRAAPELVELVTRQRTPLKTAIHFGALEAARVLIELGAPYLSEAAACKADDGSSGALPTVLLTVARERKWDFVSLVCEAQRVHYGLPAQPPPRAARKR
jgi:hypothetical protein